MTLIKYGRYIHPRDMEAAKQNRKLDAEAQSLIEEIIRLRNELEKTRMALYDARIELWRLSTAMGTNAKEYMRYHTFLNGLQKHERKVWAPQSH